MLPPSRRSISALKGEGLSLVPGAWSPAPSPSVAPRPPSAPTSVQPRHVQLPHVPAPAPRGCKPSHPSFPPSGAQLRGSSAKPAQTAPRALQRQARGALRREEEPRAPAVDAAQPGAGCARLVSGQQGRAGAPRDVPAPLLATILQRREAQGAQGVSPVRGGVLASERKPFTTSGGL